MQASPRHLAEDVDEDCSSLLFLSLLSLLHYAYHLSAHLDSNCVTLIDMTLFNPLSPVANTKAILIRIGT